MFKEARSLVRSRDLLEVYGYTNRERMNALDLRSVVKMIADHVDYALCHLTKLRYLKVLHASVCEFPSSLVRLSLHSTVELDFDVLNQLVHLRKLKLECRRSLHQPLVLSLPRLLSFCCSNSLNAFRNLLPCPIDVSACTQLKTAVYNGGRLILNEACEQFETDCLSHVMHPNPSNVKHLCARINNLNCISSLSVYTSAVLRLAINMKDASFLYGYTDRLVSLKCGAVDLSYFGTCPLLERITATVNVHPTCEFYWPKIQICIFVCRSCEWITHKPRRLELSQQYSLVRGQKPKQIPFNLEHIHCDELVLNYCEAVNIRHCKSVTLHEVIVPDLIDCKSAVLTDLDTIPLFSTQLSSLRIRYLRGPSRCTYDLRCVSHCVNLHTICVTIKNRRFEAPYLPRLKRYNSVVVPYFERVYDCKLRQEEMNHVCNFLIFDEAKILLKMFRCANCSASDEDKTKKVASYWCRSSTDEDKTKKVALATPIKRVGLTHVEGATEEYEYSSALVKLSTLSGQLGVLDARHYSELRVLRTEANPVRICHFTTLRELSIVVQEFDDGAASDALNKLVHLHTLSMCVSDMRRISARKFENEHIRRLVFEGRNCEWTLVCPRLVELVDSTKKSVVLKSLSIQSVTCRMVPHVQVKLRKLHVNCMSTPLKLNR